MTMFKPWSSKQPAEHFLALHDPEADPEAIAAALLWLEQTETGQDEFSRLQRFWNACDSVVTFLPNASFAALGLNRGWSRSFVLQLAAALILAVGLASLAFVSRLSFRSHSWSESYASAVGETRILNLPDHSQIVLGGASSVTVRYDTGARRVTLNDGEALFKVAHNKRQPFIVDSGVGSIRAVGTSFDVHRSYAGTVVTVVEGAVAVQAGDASGQSAGLLRAGMQLDYSVRGKLGAARWVDATRVVSWQSGTFRYVGEPLKVVLADLNRYSERPILIDTPQIGLLEITGTVRTDGISDWLSGLASAAGLEIIETDPGVIRLRPNAHAVAWRNQIIS
jgi:transmembrane sensor